MARGSFLWDGERWAPRHEVLAKRAAIAPKTRSTTVACPMVIGSMPAIRSPIDGRIYDSKSEYYRHVERNGCAIVGYDKNWTDHVAAAARYDEKAHEADIVSDVKRSIELVNTHGGAAPNAV